MLLTARYYTSPDGEAWTPAGQGSEDVPDEVTPLDYARTLLDKLVRTLPGDDGIRVRVWIGAAGRDDEAEVDVVHPWQEDITGRLDDVRHRRQLADAAAIEARTLETRAREARSLARSRREQFRHAVYAATRAGAPQTAIVEASGHKREWVRTTVRAVDAERIRRQDPPPRFASEPAHDDADRSPGPDVDQ